MAINCVCVFVSVSFGLLTWSGVISVMQIQRKLQIEIENQGKRLQMMFEKQREMEDGKLKGSSSSSLGEPSASLSNQVAPLSPVDKLEISNEGHEKSEISLSVAKTMPEESSQDASKKLKADDNMGEHELENDQVDAPPTKRVKS